MLPGLPQPNPGDINPELWVWNFEAIGADGFLYFPQFLTRRQAVHDFGPDPCDRPRAGSRFNTRQRSQMDEVPLAVICDRNNMEVVRKRGDDPDQLIDLYLEAINNSIGERPAAAGST